MGLDTLPGHGLVGTGAQDGVIGLWNFQRWCVCSAHLHWLKPKYEEALPNLIDGGIGGSATTLAIAEVPIGMAGVCGTRKFVALEDPSPKNNTPPLIPINYLKTVDAVLRPNNDHDYC